MLTISAGSVGFELGIFLFGSQLLMPGFNRLFSLVLLVTAAVRCAADNGWEGRILSLTEENDVSYGTDRHYTQGAKISYLSRDEEVPDWLKTFSSHLPAVGMEVQARKLGISAGQ